MASRQLTTTMKKVGMSSLSELISVGIGGRRLLLCKTVAATTSLIEPRGL